MKALPNILSVFRICLVPAFVAAYVLDGGEIKYYAIGIFIVANLSDVLDGYIARRFNAQTEIGKVLDPLGDKLITFAALICIASQYRVLIWAVCVFFIKEVLMGIGGLLIRKRAKIELPPSHWLGKAATVTFFVVCLVLLTFSHYIPDSIAVIMMAAAVALALVAFINYLRMYIKIMEK